MCRTVDSRLTRYLVFPELQYFRHLGLGQNSLEAVVWCYLPFALFVGQVCKYFLQAIEDCKYGWFWECPNGSTCIYRHALPPGFVLKKQKKEYDEVSAMQPEISMEQLVEEEVCSRRRAKVYIVSMSVTYEWVPQRERLLASGKPLTKVTLESFLAWKKRKVKGSNEFYLAAVNGFVCHSVERETRQAQGSDFQTSGSFQGRKNSWGQFIVSIFCARRCLNFAWLVSNNIPADQRTWNVWVWP